LKPYLSEQLNDARKLYNRVLSSARAVVEQAFGLLKGRWRVLHDVVSAESELVPSIVEACVSLHNFLVERDDPWEAVVDAQATHAKIQLGPRAGWRTTEPGTPGRRSSPSFGTCMGPSLAARSPARDRL